MNKRVLVLLFVLILLLCAGCKKNTTAPGETTDPAENSTGVQETAAPTEIIENLPGTAQNILDPDGFEDETEATEPSVPDPENQDPEQEATTQPEDNPSTEPESANPDTTEPSSNVAHVTYEEYVSMTPEEQLAFYNQFASMEDFVKWYNEAKVAYEEENGAIDVGDGNIDMGDIINP